MSQLFASDGQNIGLSASISVLPMNTQDWSPLGWTGWISLQPGLIYFAKNSNLFNLSKKRWLLSRLQGSIMKNKIRILSWVSWEVERHWATSSFQLLGCMISLIICFFSSLSLKMSFQLSTFQLVPCWKCILSPRLSTAGLSTPLHSHPHTSQLPPPPPLHPHLEILCLWF